MHDYLSIANIQNLKQDSYQLSYRGHAWQILFDAYQKKEFEIIDLFLHCPLLEKLSRNSLDNNPLYIHHETVQRALQEKKTLCLRNETDAQNFLDQQKSNTFISSIPLFEIRCTLNNKNDKFITLSFPIPNAFIKILRTLNKEDMNEEEIRNNLRYSWICIEQKTLFKYKPSETLFLYEILNWPIYSDEENRIHFANVIDYFDSGAHGVLVCEPTRNESETQQVLIPFTEKFVHVNQEKREIYIKHFNDFIC